MVDPNKLMLLTPGIDRKTGEYLDFGVPATVVANYLREQRIVPEKCDLNSILFLMTPAEDESKLNTLIAKLVKFKNLWDRDAPLGEVLPTLYAQNSARYAGYTLRQVCKEMHDFYRKANVKELQKLCFRASELPGARDVAEGRLRGAGRERGRLRAARRERQGPHRRDARADLSAGHRRHRARRALGRAGAADARLLPGLRGIVQPLPRLQLRSAGRLPGAGGRPHQVPHLRGSRVNPAARHEGEAVMAEQQKKMNLMQLTFIVAVNMMGSGIIMLPTNMAQVGAISLLSWIVTALGSMAIAYGFAQAGLFNQRPGGMAAYAEDAYGKAGYFQVFFLYFLSLAIGNVAIGDLGGRLSRGVLPVAVVDADRDLHRRDRAALAHDGRELRRPERHRQDRLDHGVGRHHPGRRCSRIIGWFWFSSDDLRRGVESARA